ncbi:AAA family ATPase [Lysobacter sp. M15]|uniref:AAA family ATPase n=1 Tax=Lysobacter sp. M15 TaxID=2916837 RepID=UPI001F5AF71F
MHIDFVEIANFRKLLAVRIDIAKKTTVFVGANNSGKSSAMVALRHFLVDHGEFSINDFTLSHWAKLDGLGKDWEEETEGYEAPAFDWGTVVPSLDVWLSVPDQQIHFVQKILPTLDWDGSAIGVRLRFEPKKVEDLKRDYLAARTAAKAVMAAAKAAPEDETDPFSLWPKSMIEFLSRRLRTTFEVKAYLLDPAQLKDPADGEAWPQPLPDGSEPLTDDPFKGLIRIDEISAQRGLGMASPRAGREDATGDEGPRLGKKLSTQLRGYYAQHLDPFEQPEEKDLKALQAIHSARVAFGKQLSESFEVAIKELETIGYPGLTDPKLTLAADLRPLDALKHGSAVHYEVPTHLADAGFVNRLPEDSNGLGYQNLVSMVFALMSYRDKRMLVGKAGRKTATEEASISPLHLVLVEEPEAHLHAQVQQVFISHAYDVLRRHPSLGESDDLRTQMVVSTHSSHIAHEAEFASLRYFRRMPINLVKGSVPISRVVCLSRTFGDDENTKRFVRRYLKITHCDLFFADGAILVEGPAERIIVPHMVRNREPYKYLTRCYITWLEIGGSHAHRLKSLLADLGLNTLVITDLDAKTESNANAVPKRGENLFTRNQTMKTWVPKVDALDPLLDMKPESLASLDKSGVGVRVAYQQPTTTTFGTDTDGEALANTFEDALVYRNVEYFRTLNGTGLAKKFREALSTCKNLGELAEKLHAALSGGDKAELAMTMLESQNLKDLVLPDYIDTGLKWLIDQLRRKEDDVAGKLPIALPGTAPAAPEPVQEVQA